MRQTRAPALDRSARAERWALADRGLELSGIEMLVPGPLPGSAESLVSAARLAAAEAPRGGWCA